MATEVHQFTVSIPANTAKSNLYKKTITLDNRVVESIDLDVPPGPSYLMGFYIGHSGAQLIPYESGEFIVWDDWKESWILSDYPTGQGWFVTGYNLDLVNDHAVAVRFHTVLPPLPTPTAPVITFISTPAPSPVVTL